MSIDNVLALKKFGSVALNSGNYYETLKHLTEAIDLLNQSFNTSDKESLKSFSTNNLRLESNLYSKRSVAFLKLGQYYNALQDAKRIINISPEWFKGYLRQADVELECRLFQNALKDYQISLRYLDQETSQSKCAKYEKLINQKVKHVLFMIQREQAFDYQVPWIGAAFGLVVGMAIVTWDYISHGTRSYINHPILKLACIGCASYVFFHFATLLRSLGRKYKQKLLKPPYGSRKK